MSRKINELEKRITELEIKSNNLEWQIRNIPTTKEVLEEQYLVDGWRKQREASGFDKSKCINFNPDTDQYYDGQGNEISVGDEVVFSGSPNQTKWTIKRFVHYPTFIAASLRCADKPLSGYCCEVSIKSLILCKQDDTKHYDRNGTEIKVGDLILPLNKAKAERIESFPCCHELITDEGTFYFADGVVLFERGDSK